MTINKIIIATTAICRIEVHNKSFSSYLNFLDKIKNDYDIKWFINLDKPDYCKDDIIETQINLNKLLEKYNCKIITTETSNFLTAVKNLLTNIISEIDDNTCLLWLEDDWIASETLDIKYIIETILLPKSFISLVYNKLGSFPPYLMGSELSKTYILNFIKNKQINNPEKISRYILRQIANNNGIKYFSFFDKKYINLLITDDNLFYELNDNKLCYEESYLKINDTNILVLDYNDKIYFNNFLKTNVVTIKDYINFITNNNIIFIRFGFADMHIEYEYSFFKDIGREWKKNNNINKNV